MQAFLGELVFLPSPVGREEIRASLKTPAWEARVIDLVMVFDAILTSRQTRAKLQCLYENLIWNNFRRTAGLKKNMICKLMFHS